MARRSAPPPKPKTPVLTVGQTQLRIKRLHRCIATLEAFEPQKARKREPAVLALEAAIDKALCSAFGYGTASYLRYNRAGTLDPCPLLRTSRFALPPRDLLVHQHGLSSRIFLRTKSERSACFEKRLAPSKKKLRASNRVWPCRRTQVQCP